MENYLTRLEMLYGKEKVGILKRSRVAVFGVGGVGGYAVEALARSGIGSLDIFDNDTVSVSNINRQIIATSETVGKLKTEVERERILIINPGCTVNAQPVFFAPDTLELFNFSQYDYVVDAIDFVTGKILLAVECEKAGVPIISAMGAGNKKRPELLEIADIYQTSVCPLARVMRRELKKRGVKGLTVVYSKELPSVPLFSDGEKTPPASSCFVPACAGMIIAGKVINDLVGEEY